MKKYILSAILAGTTALVASPALALDPCKYSVGVSLGWSAAGKTTYTTNIVGYDPTATTGGFITSVAPNNITMNKYTVQKGFPKFDLRLGYNVNSFMQLGVNFAYTNNLETNDNTFMLGANPTGVNYLGNIVMKDTILDILIKGHFYTAESCTGTSMFMGPSLGWQHTSSKLTLGVTGGGLATPYATSELDLKNKDNFTIAMLE